MRAPIDDTIWAAMFGSAAAVQAAFDRFGPVYHEAILASGVPFAAADFIMPHVRTETSAGIDFGCGSGVLGMGLMARGFPGPLDGVDLSTTMLDLARQTRCYRHLWQANLLEAEAWPVKVRYPFIISVGLVGDYVPYYSALPRMVECLEPGGLFGLAVEQRSTPYLSLAQLMDDLGLDILASRELEVPPNRLEAQTYEFFVTRKRKPA